MLRSGNPALTAETFRVATPAYGAEAMTLQGTVNKTGISLLVLLATAAFVWRRFFEAQSVEAVVPFMWAGIIGGMVAALVTVFKKEWAPVTTPIYAGLEGLALGGISAFFEARFAGIVINAVALTFGTLAALLLAYRSGLIRATENFKLGIVAATGAIALLYFLGMVLSLFGTRSPYVHESGAIGIGFSLVVVVIAALNLVLDFDFIEKGVEQEAPKHMEWYGAFGLLVTLIWLYLEILHLLAKLQGRSRE